MMTFRSLVYYYTLQVRPDDFLILLLRYSDRQRGEKLRFTFFSQSEDLQTRWLSVCIICITTNLLTLTILISLILYPFKYPAAFPDNLIFLINPGILPEI
ncbi:MAG TPA: hypothetical protein VIK55_01975 [Paludibacter sp.]